MMPEKTLWIVMCNPGQPGPDKTPIHYHGCDISNPNHCTCSKISATCFATMRVMVQNGYDRVVRLNLCPIRTLSKADFKHLNLDNYSKEMSRNLEWLTDMPPNVDVWCAWGNLPEKLEIVRNTFLLSCELTNRKLWCTEVLKNGDPHHPIRGKSDTLIPYSVNLQTGE
jgi:hypothetical protein